MVLPLLYGEEAPIGRQAADSQVEVHEKAYSTGEKKLRQGRSVLPEKTKTGAFALGV